MENFTNKDLKDFSDKLTEGYNRVVPKHLRLVSWITFK
jgi:hypothetical protein